MSNLNNNTNTESMKTEFISVEKGRAKLYDGLKKIFADYEISGQTTDKTDKSDKLEVFGFSKNKDNKLSFDSKNFNIKNLIENLVKKEPEKGGKILSRIQEETNSALDYTKNISQGSSEAKSSQTKAAEEPKSSEAKADTKTKSAFDNRVEAVEVMKLMKQTRELLQKTAIDTLESIEKRQKSYSAKEGEFLNAGVLNAKSIKNLKNLIKSPDFTAENLTIFSDHLMNVSGAQEASVAAYANFDENNFAVMRNVNWLNETKEQLLANVGFVNNYLNMLGDDKSKSFLLEISTPLTFSEKLESIFTDSLSKNITDSTKSIDSEIKKLKDRKDSLNDSRTVAKVGNRMPEKEIDSEIKTIDAKIKKLEEQKGSYEKLSAYALTPVKIESIRTSGNFNNFEAFKERSIAIEETVNGAFHLKKANFPKINLGIFDYLKKGQIGKAFKNLGNALLNPIGKSSKEYQDSMSEEKAYNLSIDNFKKLIKEFTVYSTEIDKMNENLEKNSGLAKSMENVSVALNDKFSASRESTIEKIIEMAVKHDEILYLEKIVKDLEKQLKDEKKEETKVDTNAKNTNIPKTPKINATDQSKKADTKAETPALAKSELEKKLEDAKKNLKGAQMEFADFSVKKGDLKTPEGLLKTMKEETKAVKDVNKTFTTAFDRLVSPIVKVFAALFESLKSLVSKKDVGEQELKSNLKLSKAELYNAQLNQPTK